MDKDGVFLTTAVLPLAIKYTVVARWRSPADGVAGLGGLTVQAHCLSGYSHYPPPQPPAQLSLHQGGTLWLTLGNGNGAVTRNYYWRDIPSCTVRRFVLGPFQFQSTSQNTHSTSKTVILATLAFKKNSTHLHSNQPKLSPVSESSTHPLKNHVCFFSAHLQARELCPQTYSPSLPLEWSQVTHIPASIKSGGAYNPEKSAFYSTVAIQLCDDTRLPGWLSAFPPHSQTIPLR